MTTPRSATRPRSRREHDAERGAAAVEFALVVPLLVLLVVAIFEFGRAYHAQIALTAAAREGARVMAVTNRSADAISATRAAAPTLALSDGQIEVNPSSCSAGSNVTVRVTYPLSMITGLLGSGFTLNGHAVMRCGG
jgi:Flp pilus assembly protein TadG